MIAKCAYCDLPTMVHFAHCKGSGIFGPMPEWTLKPGAVQVDARELRWCKPVDSDKLKALKHRS